MTQEQRNSEHYKEKLDKAEAVTNGRLNAITTRRLWLGFVTSEEEHNEFLKALGIYANPFMAYLIIEAEKQSKLGTNEVLEKLKVCRPARN
ncbi:hypothetical protein KBD71_01425 [Candidatus Woesebacteria bacterium]|nr:hypothetical protein [Candidatus Woesebacteria bacterium]